jgi:flavodoxin
MATSIDYLLYNGNRPDVQSSGKRGLMKALVVFDSIAGNTEKVARAIASGIAGAVAVRVGSPEARDLEKLSLLVVGSPTYGGKPTESIQKYLDSIPAPALKKLHVATFDTRLKMKFARIFGFAADKIASKLGERGSTVHISPTGFIVKGRSGPLADGELERAAAWGRELSAYNL